MSSVLVEMPAGCAGAIDFGPDIDFNNPPAADAQPVVIDWSIASDGLVLSEGTDAPSQALPRIGLQLDPAVFTDTWTLPLDGFIEYWSLDGDLLGRVDVDLEVDVAVRTEVAIDPVDSVTEDTLVTQITATVTRTDPGLGREAVIAVETTDCSVTAGGIGEEAGRTVLYRGDVDEPVDVAFTLAAVPGCRFSVKVFGEASSGRLNAGEYVRIEPSAPSGPRIESSNCDEERCTIVFSATSNSALNNLVQVNGLADEEFSTYGTKSIWVYPLPAANPGDRIVYGAYETLPVDSFCFSATTASVQGLLTTSSETQCADLIDGAFVQRDPLDDLLPVARPDSASAAVAETISINWSENDRVSRGELTSVTEGDLLGGSVVIDGRQLLFTGGTPGEATFDYTICDLDGACDSATVTVDVVPCSLPPLRYYWDLLGFADDPSVASARLAEVVDCNGNALTSFGDETISGAVGLGRVVYAQAESVNPTRFGSAMTLGQVPVGPNGTVSFEGWYQYELPDGTVMGRGTFSSEVEVPVAVSVTAELDRSVLVEGEGQPLLTLTGSLGSGVTSRQIIVDMAGCSALNPIETTFRGSQIVFRDRVESTFTIEIPLRNGPCGAAFIVTSEGGSNARPHGGGVALDFFYAAPEVGGIEATSCVDSMCEVTFAATRLSSYLTDVVIVGWGSNGSSWNTLSVHNTPTTAAYLETVSTTATFAETPSFCAASVGDHNLFFPRLDGLGELFCADLVDGAYIQRPPSAEESALYPN